MFRDWNSGGKQRGAGHFKKQPKQFYFYKDILRKRKADNAAEPVYFDISRAATVRVVPKAEPSVRRG
jgi:hypothetical protein